MNPVPLYTISNLVNLYEYEEPVLFISKVGFLQAIFLKIDEQADLGEFLSCYIDDEHVLALKEGRISIRGVFETQKNIHIVKIDHSMKVLEEEPISISILEEHQLPERNVGLLPRFGFCPDVMEEKDSLLTVYFSGGQLNRDAIPYSTLMGLLSGVQSLAKNAILPPSLRGLRNSTLDFLVGDPALGSLMISIKRPTFKLGSLRKSEERKDITANDVNFGVRNNKDIFFESVEDLFSAEHQTVDSDIELYSNLKSILPDAEGSFSNVTLSTSVNGISKRINIDVGNASRVSAKFEDQSGLNVNRTGTIVEINASSGTLLLKSLLGVVTTCKFPKPLYENLTLEPDFKIGSKLDLRGDVYERARRDYMNVDRVIRLLPRP